MSDLALRTRQREAAAGIADAQAAADRAAVRAGLATPAQLYRDAIREGRRRPWTERQKAAALDGLRLEARAGITPTGITPTGICSMVLYHLGAHYRDPGQRWLSMPALRDRERVWPRLRAWAERVLAETGP